MSDWQDLDYFDYELPESRISQIPRMPRDSARLLVDQAQEIEHTRVSELCKYFKAGDVLVLNNTKVRHARLFLEKSTGGKVEVLLLSPVGVAGENRWRALVKPSKRVPEGTELFASGTADRHPGTADRHPGLDPGSPEAEPVLCVQGGDEQSRFIDILDSGAVTELGQVPLPPYISEQLDDPSRYQTVYAQQIGSAAAPTAGLHLTDTLLQDLRDMGVEIHEVELEVGIGTFRPIAVDDVNDHAMHCLLYTSPSPRDRQKSRMPSSA